MEVLVVEDEVRLARALAQGLESRGFSVTLAHDGQSGYERAKERTADVIVLDLMLPSLSGEEVCRRLREHESFDELLTQLRQAHARLGHAVKNAPDVDKPCFRRPNGDLVTGRQRLEVLARHWAEHVRELQTAAKSTDLKGVMGWQAPL